MNTNRWMQEVNARFPVRKSKVQKAQFRQYVLQKAQKMGYAARMEETRQSARTAISSWAMWTRRKCLLRRITTRPQPSGCRISCCP